MTALYKPRSQKLINVLARTLHQLQRNTENFQLKTPLSDHNNKYPAKTNQIKTNHSKKTPHSNEHKRQKKKIRRKN